MKPHAAQFHRTRMFLSRRVQDHGNAKPDDLKSSRCNTNRNKTTSLSRTCRHRATSIGECIPRYNRPYLAPIYGVALPPPPPHNPLSTCTGHASCSAASIMKVHQIRIAQNILSHNNSAHLGYSTRLCSHSAAIPTVEASLICKAGDLMLG